MITTSSPARSTEIENVDAVARVADRVLGEVLDHDAQHPRPERHLRLLVELDVEQHSGPRGPLGEPVHHLAHDRRRGSRRERDDRAAGLQLAQEQDVVDQLADVLDLGLALLEQLVDVRRGQRRGLEQREQPGERRPELVRDRSGEPGAKLLVGGELTRLAQVEERFARAVDLDRNAPRTPRLALQELLREQPGRARAHRGSRARDGSLRSADRPRRATSTISELSSSSRRPRSASSSAFSIIGVSMAKVLIVEDDDVIAQGMAHHLSLAGYDPVVVADGDTGLKRLRFETPDVCVVDLMLPRMDGWQLIESARGEGLGTPIIVVSARGTEHDRVHALEIGADDYLVKPFSMKELVARVQVASRRGGREQPEERGEPIEIEELRIDPLNVQAYLDGESADLTPTEFRLLYALALERGRVVSRDELLQKLWGRREGHRDRTVDVFVRKLRDKIDRQAPRHTFIQTRYGVGYKLEPEPK